ncbi:MAG: hypothetical protein SNJ70_09260, partial [Armatimonadota bacterium]
MRKLLAAIVVLAVILSFSSMAAAQWTKVGDGNGAQELLGNLWDFKRTVTNDIVVDSTGRIFVTSNNCQNGNDKGFVTIFTPSGSSYTRYDIDLQNCRLYDGNNTTPGSNVQGSITRLILGEDEDGNVCVYGVQNWMENNWDANAGHDVRIIQIRPDPNASGQWAVRVMVNAGQNFDDRIESIASGPNGGFVYTRNGNSNYWKYNYFWKYDPVTQAHELALPPNTNSGWSRIHKLYNIEYVGGDWWAIFHTTESSNNEYNLSAIGINKNRRNAANGQNPNSGAYYGIARPTTPLSYDPVNNRLWYGGRGRYQNGDWHNMIIRWDGDPNSNTGLFTATEDDPKTGITTQKIGHAFPKGVGEQYGSWIWVSALAANPNDGSGWFAMSETIGPYDNYIYPYSLDNVYVKFDIPYVEGLAIQSMGAPQPGNANRVMALTIKGDTAYALVVNRTTGVYSVYKRSAIVSQYGNTASLADVKKG